MIAREIVKPNRITFKKSLKP